MTPTGARLRAASIAALALAVMPASAASPDVAGAPPGASSCSGCHAVRASSGSSLPPIHGRPAAEILAALEAFRAGTRPATVMNRIAPGFSPEESQAIAAWLSGQGLR